MATRSSASSRRGKRISVSAESLFSRPLNQRQKAVLTRIAKHQTAGRDTRTGYSDQKSGVKSIETVLKKGRPFPLTKFEDVAGCLKYKGRAKTLREMERSIAKGVHERHERGRY